MLRHGWEAAIELGGGGEGESGVSGVSSSKVSSTVGRGGGAWTDMGAAASVGGALRDDRGREFGPGTSALSCSKTTRS